MLIKSAEEKTEDIQSLERLLCHRGAGTDTRKKIEQEIRFMQSGMKGEREAAYEIDFHFGNSKNWAIIHDLRIEHEGRVAQIDHLLIDRTLEIYVCESKRFGEGVAINEYGEWSAFFGGKPYGLPSPLEQNRKHQAVLKSLFEDGVVELPRRLGFSIKPSIMSLILVSKNARIARPKAKISGLDEIIKVDQIRAHIDKLIDDDKNVFGLAKVVASDTLKQFAERLAAAHKPLVFDWPAKFGLSEVVQAKAEEPKMRQEREEANEALARAPATVSASASPKVDAVPEDKPAKAEASSSKASGSKSKYFCASCRKGVSDEVAKFCWGNPKRFGGKVYCMICQKK